MAAVLYIVLWFSIKALVSADCSNELPVAEPLLVGAFNIRVFGKAKMAKPKVVKSIIRIIQRYDLVLIQEIRDVTGMAFPSLVEKLNKETSAFNYAYVLGPRVGTTSMKEQYGFIYRRNRLEPMMGYTYSNQGRIFERPPYIVKFRRTTSTGVQKIFNFIPLHAKPSSAISEINALELVYEDSITQTGIRDAVIAGDLNADCSYVCKSCWERVTLRRNSSYRWIIGDEVDTAIYSTHCAYDRIILTGSMISTAFGGKVYAFDIELNLSHTGARDVSDHYPVEFTVV